MYNVHLSVIYSVFAPEWVTWRGIWWCSMRSTSKGRPRGRRYRCYLGNVCYLADLSRGYSVSSSSLRSTPNRGREPRPRPVLGTIFLGCHYVITVELVGVSHPPLLSCQTLNSRLSTPRISSHGLDHRHSSPASSAEVLRCVLSSMSLGV